MTNDETRAEVLAKLAERWEAIATARAHVKCDGRQAFRDCARLLREALATVPPQPASDPARGGNWYFGWAQPASAGPEVERFDSNRIATIAARIRPIGTDREKIRGRDDCDEAARMLDAFAALTRAASVSAPTPCAGCAEKDAKLEIQKADRDSWRRVAESIQAAATKAEQARDTAEAKLREMEKLVYIGEHHFPDLTWKARCEETVVKLREAQAEIERLKAIADVTDLTDGQPISFAALCDSIDSKRLTDQVYDLVINHIRRREAAEARCAELKQKALEMRGIIANGMDGWDSIDVGRAQKVLDDPEFKDG
jgi:hypothetical protein